MHLREHVLGLARLHTLRGEPVPADLLAQADSLGILLSELDQPTNPTTINRSKEKRRWPQLEPTSEPTKEGQSILG